MIHLFAKGDDLSLTIVQQQSPVAAVFVGSPGNDTFSGLSSADQIYGYDGNDVLSGGGGDDEILGHAGDDRLDGGEGYDLIQGGDGNDVITDTGGGGFLAGQNGNDTLIGGNGNHSLWGGAGDDSLVGGDGDDTLNGGDTITGDTGHDNLIGGNGNDLLITGGGADTVNGGAGDDVLAWGRTDTALGVFDGGDGIDTFRYDSGDIYGSFAGYEILDGGSNEVRATAAFITSFTTVTGTRFWLTDAGALDLSAVATGIQVTAGAGATAITTGAGNDTLIGSSGADTLAGGAGDDVYHVTEGDSVTEAEDAGSDTVITALSYTLGANLERLTQTGDGDLTATGNALDNVVTSTAGHNRLDGGAGADTLNGGLGDDTYVVDNAADTTIEAADGGSDTVLTSVSYTLSAGIETLTLTGEALDGTGNATNNTIIGTDGHNRLDGDTGVDTLGGGLGDDTYVVDDADALIEAEGAGTDTVLASVDHNLAEQVENLTLTGVAHLTGTGNALNNTVTGNTGNNALDGGTGLDTLAGGLGDDTYTVDNTGDKVVELGGEGTDTVVASVSYSLFARFAENLTLTGAENLNAIGNSLKNVLTGNAGNNLLDAAAGNDWLDGGLGADTLKGGLGDDTFLVDGDDTVIEADAGGRDTVLASVSHALAAQVETLTLTGTDHTNATGNDLANAITGNGGHNIIDGGTGADSLAGGLGNDTYLVDNAGDTVVEAAGGGTDLIVASVSYALAGRVAENLTLTGEANLNATGNGLSNALTGNAGNNKLDGLAGNDVLDGGAGADSLTGGLGDDTYYVDHAGDKVTEAHLEGNDTIISSVTYSLFGRAVEVLTLTGTEHLTAIGNSLANTLTGNAGDNSLDGGTGADTLSGGLGNDTYVVDNASDKVVELNGEGADLILASVTYTLAGRVVESLTLTGVTHINATGNSLANTLTGNSGVNKLDGGAGHDRLDGGAGADSLTGGLGDDTYLVDNTGDKVFETHFEGTDTIISSVSYSLFGRAVEVLTLTGEDHLTALGNTLGNAITGNAGHNSLDGGVGADTLSGGLGNDSYYVDDAGDVVTETGNSGTDAIFASVSYSLAGRTVESLTLTGTGHINATGNGVANLLVGNSGNNHLDGGAGSDVLTGGLGADVFVFLSGSRKDTVTDFSASDNDTIDIHAYTGGVANAGLVTQSGADVLITLGGGNVVTVLNATQADVLAHMVW